MKTAIFILILTVITSSAFCKTITVTSSADSGAGTLRQAVLDAVDDDTIIFAPGISTIFLSNELRFNKNLTVNGNPTTKTIISVSPGYYSFGFIIETDSKIIVNNLIFKNFNINSSCDGTVINFGRLSVKYCLFTNNKTLSSTGSGAAITNAMGSTLYIEKSEFRQNQSALSGGALVATSNTITYISDCVFEDNSAPLGSAIISFGNMTIINSSFINNNTSSGAVVRAGYGTIYSADGNLNLINCVFNSNKGTYCSTIANDINSTAFVVNTLFVNNTCTSDLTTSTIFNGITNDSTSILTLVNNTIADNNTIGVYNNLGTVILYNNILSNNSTDLHTANGIITSANNLIGTSNTNLTGNGNIFNTDPLFVGNGDYSLQENSPAINQGDNSFFPDTILIDLSGNSRFSGSSIDLGAYEYQQISAGVLNKYNSNLKIYSQGHAIYVEDALLEVKIYNVMGKLVAEGKNSVFPVSKAGIYIVKADNTVRKIIVE